MKERFTNVAQKTLDVFVKFASTKAITALKDGFVLSMPIHGPVHSCGVRSPFSKRAVCDHSDLFPSEVRTRTRQKTGLPEAGNLPP